MFHWNGWHWELVGIVVQMAGANFGMFGMPVTHLAGSVPSTDILELLHRE